MSRSCKIFNAFSVLVAIGIACTPISTTAAIQSSVKNHQGTDVFTVNFFDVNELNPDGSRNYFNLSEKDRSQILAGLQRWADMIRTPDNPAIINVYTLNDYNAYGGFIPIMHPDGTAEPPILRVLNNRPDADLSGTNHAFFGIGLLPFADAEMTPSQLPRAGALGMDYPATILHEFAHAAGWVSTARNSNGAGTPMFRGVTPWDAGLRDDNGNPVHAGQAIMCTGCVLPSDPSTAFDVRLDQAYFTGSHVREVLNGAMSGIPVTVHAERGNPLSGLDTNYLAHSELRNSVMSHQRFRNYTNMMEAEIAVLQDIGLQIDRRNLFGHSIYNDDVTLINHNGFFARNADGTAYLPGQYNRAFQGLGLHIYGERNTITQAADILSAGDGGVGVRIDGSQNTLYIPTQTRIHAHGWYGRGLQVSYGRHHQIVQQGEVRADGEDGVGALFDFGDSAMGNDTDLGEYRGSWIRRQEGVDASLANMLPELQGALVSQYDLSGTLSGRKAAIEISKNAWVENINIMQGARLEGDILSSYDWRLPTDNSRLLTALSFGRLADAQGRATSAADSNFLMRYDGNIQGATSFNVVLAGGTTSLNGKHSIYTLRVDPGATLMGNSTYILHQEGEFINLGTLQPGNSLGSIHIQGNFVQGSSGTMVLETLARDSDRITVDGDASLAGELQLKLLPDWYASDWRIETPSLFAVSGTTLGQFERFTDNGQSLPTLQLVATGNGWVVQRSSNAYSQYASNPNALAVGRALDRASTPAQASIAAVYQGMDFSAADGSGVRTALQQLGVGAYGAQLAASLRREQLVSSQLFQRSLPNHMSSSWQPFAQAYGDTYRWQLNDNDVDYRSNTYGLMLGADQQSASSDWRWGAHVNVNTQKLNIQNPSAEGRLDTLAIGLHAMYRGQSNEGWSGIGQIRTGLENGRLDRQLGFGTYQGSVSSQWTGWMLAAGVQLRYQWPLGLHDSIGPVMGLDYVHYQRPGITEDGGAARLNVASASADSLRASLGLALEMRWDPNPDRRVKMQLSAIWEQALLNRTQSQSAYFADSPTVGFTGTYARVDQHALALRAGVQIEASKGLTLALSAGTRVLADSRSEFEGNLSLQWRY